MFAGTDAWCGGGLFSLLVGLLLSSVLEIPLAVLVEEGADWAVFPGLPVTVIKSCAPEGGGRGEEEEEILLLTDIMPSMS